MVVEKNGFCIHLDERPTGDQTIERATRKGTGKSRWLSSQFPVCRAKYANWFRIWKTLDLFAFKAAEEVIQSSDMQNFPVLS